MKDGTSGFVHALTIPSIISVIRKVQHDAGESLRVMHDYHRRQADGSNLSTLSAAEDAALTDILSIAITQSIGGVIYYSFSCLAVMLGGRLVGQAAQIAVAVNTLTAPGKLYIDAGGWFVKAASVPTTNIARMGGAAERRRLAYLLGRYAGMTGYHAPGSATAVGQGEPRRALAAPRPIQAARRDRLRITFVPPSLSANPSP